MSKYLVTGPGITATVEGDGFVIGDRVAVYVATPVQSAVQTPDVLDNTAPQTTQTIIASFPLMCGIQIKAD